MFLFFAQTNHFTSLDLNVIRSHGINLVLLANVIFVFFTLKKQQTTDVSVNVSKMLQETYLQSYCTLLLKVLRTYVKML